MKKLHILPLGVCLLFLGVALNYASEEPVKMADLPPAVQATAKEQGQGATVRRIVKEVENGKTTYELELIVNGHGKDVSIAPDGTVVEVEEEVPLESIPAAARAAIEKAAGNGKILKVESVTHGSKVVAYEAQVVRARRKVEVRVGPDGRPRPE